RTLTHSTAAGFSHIPTGGQNGQVLQSNGVSGAAVWTTIAAGAGALTLTRGAYLTGANYNGTTATTWAVDATPAATAGKIVVRDGSADILTRYFKSNVANVTTITGAMAFRSAASSGIEFCSDKAAIRTWLGASATGGDTSYVKKSGDAMTGALSWNARGSCLINSGGLDGASSADANLILGSWYGIGFKNICGAGATPVNNNGQWFDVRNGNSYSRGEWYAQSNQRVYHTNFKPTSTDVGLGNVPNTTHTAAATASTVVLRDGSADITTRYFKSNVANVSTISGAMAFRTAASSGIEFCSSPEIIRTWLGASASGGDATYVKKAGDTMTGALQMGLNNINFTASDTGDITFNEAGGARKALLYSPSATGQNFSIVAGATMLLNSAGLASSGQLITNSQLVINKTGRTTTISSDNVSYTHYNTSADVGHWFNKQIRVQGDIYCGPSYTNLVWSTANLAFGTGATNMATGNHTHTAAQVGLGNVANFGYSNAIGDNSVERYATTNMVAQVRAELKSGIVYGGNSTARYGVNDVQFSNFSGVGGTGANGAQLKNPTSDWYHHATFNHGNSSGFYVDLAMCFHSDTYSFRRVSSGVDQGWARIYTDKNKPNSTDVGLGNVGNYAAVNKAGDTMSGNLVLNGSAILQFAPSNGLSIIDFANTGSNNDRGWIRHQNASSANAYMQFCVSDDPFAGGDYFTFGASTGNSTGDGTYTPWLDIVNNMITVKGTNGWLQLGPQNGSHCHIYTDRPSFYFNKEAYINGGQIWHSGNFNKGSYSNNRFSTRVVGIDYAGNDAMYEMHKPGVIAYATSLISDNRIAWVQTNGGGGWVNNLLASDQHGNVVASGNVTAYSDIRLKKDLVIISDAVNKINQLNGYTYTRIDNGERCSGVVAQEVQKVLPEVVLKTKASEGAEDQTDTLSIAYGNMVGLLIEGIKELKREIDDLKSQLNKSGLNINEGGK
ncbi:MAG: tail fiber domain-containing protein, partial [Fusobacteriaceae bacterium]